LYPFFSIIIPTYNRGHLIADTINTVIMQVYRHFELIVVDDGSTDNTRQVVEELIANNASVQIHYYHKENGERGAARNFGLDLSKGDYVLYFDSDDELYEDHLLEASRFIEKNPHTEWFHLQYEIKDAVGKKISEAPVYDSPPNRYLISGNFLSCNAVFIRRDIAVVNRFNEDRVLSAAEDWELWLRLAAQFPLHYINRITSVIINHDERSVLTTNKDKLIARISLLTKCVTSNKKVAGYYKNDMPKFIASCYSYISLHLALTGKYKIESIKYLAKSISVLPAFIFQRRFAAIIKHLF
jgi:glycosyltransferase involved in cell wall biosynthesis